MPDILQTAAQGVPAGTHAVDGLTATAARTRYPRARQAAHPARGCGNLFFRWPQRQPENKFPKTNPARPPMSPHLFSALMCLTGALFILANFYILLALRRGKGTSFAPFFGALLWCAGKRHPEAARHFRLLVCRSLAGHRHLAAARNGLGALGRRMAAFVFPMRGAVCAR